MVRRRFLSSAVTGGVAACAAPILASGGMQASPSLSPDALSAQQAPAFGWQGLHPDGQTDVPGVEYFFLGNGLITAVIQHAGKEAVELGLTPLGLMLWDPHEFSRKWSTFTFHPEWGLARGMMNVTIGGELHRPGVDAIEVVREYPDEIPTVVAIWQAGDTTVEERFWVDADEPVLYREVSVSSSSQPSLSTSLYYSHVLFVDYRSERDTGTLRASGYAHVELFSEPQGEAIDRFLAVEPRQENGAWRARYVYVGKKRREEVARRSDTAKRDAWARSLQAVATVSSDDNRLDHLFRASVDGIRATVARSGRYDASIWQYNMEWVIDASAVAMAATQSGQQELARAMLENMITRLSSKEGIMAHASRFRYNLETELNQQGALLGALWTYWAWTGDHSLAERHWDQIKRIANFPLQQPFLHESGLLFAAIEFFERTEAMGVQPGFELGHQSFVAWGLERAAVLADALGDTASADSWRRAAQRMADAMLNHPQLSFVEDGVLIKRRLPDGSQQQVLRPHAVGTDDVPTGMPLAEEENPLLDPDISLLTPILHDQIPPDSELAAGTLQLVRTLWDSEGRGGYLRYHPSGDPDAPGGWTFPTAIAARAHAEAGDGAEVRRILDWFLSVQGARGGSYFEFYALRPRPVPPLPPMGVIVWGWAELATLFVEHLLGARPTTDGTTLAFRPSLPAGVDRLNGTVSFRGHKMDIQVARTDGEPSARFKGRALERRDGVWTLPAPLETAGTVEIRTA